MKKNIRTIPTEFIDKIMKSMSVVDMKPKNIRIGISSAHIIIPQYDQPVTFVQHFDYVNGCAWNEANKYLPPVNHEYSNHNASVLHSESCMVTLKDNRITTAVYIVADDDGIGCKGWVEIPDKHPLEWCFVERIFSGDTLDVVRWHYI